MTTIQLRASAELELRRRLEKRPVEEVAQEVEVAPVLGWFEWLTQKFATSVKAGFAKRHEEFWEWVWSIEDGKRPRPFVSIWPRGGAKSTSAELAVTAIAERGVRSYCIYVCETQQQADDHVASIATKLGELGMGKALDKFGKFGSWRRNRLRTAGFTVDALGLDVASRGKKIDDQRPDVIVFDDIDSQSDSPKVTKKKKKTITSAILPAMAAGCAVLFVQNLIHANSIASELVDGRAGFLVDRIVSGPHKAAEELVVKPIFDEEIGRIRNVVVSCKPTWAGQGIEQIQEAIDTYGLKDFMQESQHDVFERDGALWSRALLDMCYVENAPSRFRRVVVAVDPSGGGDEIGIIVVGLGFDNLAYVLADRTVKGKAGSLAWGRAVVRAYQEFEADRVIAESNFGGDMVKATIKVSDNSVPVRLVHASRGKEVRAEPVSALYGEMTEEGAVKQLGSVRHVGGFTELETELTTWTPDETWSPNRLDALVWALTELMLKTQQQSTDTTYSTSGRAMAMRRR